MLIVHYELIQVLVHVNALFVPMDRLQTLLTTDVLTVLLVNTQSVEHHVPNAQLVPTIQTMDHPPALIVNVVIHPLKDQQIVLHVSMVNSPLVVHHVKHAHQEHTQILEPVHAHHVEQVIPQTELLVLNVLPVNTLKTEFVSIVQLVCSVWMEHHHVATVHAVMKQM